MAIIAALDLSMVVSVNVLGAIWLWKRQPWGYVLAAIANVKGVVYMLALAASAISAVRAGVSEDLSQVALWGGYRRRLPDCKFVFTWELGTLE